MNDMNRPTGMKAARKPCPYVGPRPVRAGEPFYGREDEFAGLMDKLLPGGVALLHSPSGAGKTSLIQAAVVPKIVGHGFQVCGATKPRFSALRVNLPPPSDFKVANRYVFSVVNGLVGHLVDRHEAATMTIEDALLRFAQEADQDSRQMIVIDQLEEILTLNPADIEGQLEFFIQLGTCLRRGRRWALLAMREDYMGALSRFKRYFPNELRVTYRLDFPDIKAATDAMQKPAADCGVTFTDDAAGELAADLRQVRTDNGGDSAVTSPYVEPVLLQVVCDRLWRVLSKDPEFTAIKAEDLAKVRPFDKTLSRYYRSVVKEAVRKDPDAERNVRDWIGQHLISKQGMRRTTLSLPAVKNHDEVVRALSESYLIRDDPRPGGTWWELSHDMLVLPIAQDNDSWRLSYLAPWQVLAEEWQRSDRNRGFLLRGAQLQEARSLARWAELTDLEKAFLGESQRTAADESRLARLQDQVSRSRVVNRVSLALNVLLFAVLLTFLVWTGG